MIENGQEADKFDRYTIPCKLGEFAVAKEDV